MIAEWCSLILYIKPGSIEYLCQRNRWLAKRQRNSSHTWHREDAARRLFSIPVKNRLSSSALDFFYCSSLHLRHYGHALDPVQWCIEISHSWSVLIFYIICIVSGSWIASADDDTGAERFWFWSVVSPWISHLLSVEWPKPVQWPGTWYYARYRENSHNNNNNNNNKSTLPQWPHGRL